MLKFNFEGNNMTLNNNYFDVIILGAGLSGIGAAYHIQDKCANKTFTILEGRENMGGTWDYFKYPGLRSDSDMFTLGYPFRPWKEQKAIADGSSILKYIKETAEEFGLDKKIRFQHKVLKADWNSETQLWTLEIETPENKNLKLTCSFFYSCSGYYSYKEGYTPDFKNKELFEGKTMHPQAWETEYNYTDKKIVVIGSGATAVTLVPELAKKAEHVTMLQRSPTYITSVPSKDKNAARISKWFPAKIARSLNRWKNIMYMITVYQIATRWPNKLKELLLTGVKRWLGDKADIEKDYTPKYNPWEQRLCVVPDGDFFKAIKKDKASIITDHIESFTKGGILLKSGKEIKADLIVTATGLNIELVGGVKVSIDGKEGETSSLHSYRGVMLSDVPNFAIAIGYTNASWTLKCDLNSKYVCRVLNYMDKNNLKTVIPKFDSKYETNEAFLNLDASYIQRSISKLPRQGSKSPWRVYQNYIYDLFSIKYSKIKGTGLKFE
ncbi:MAG: flavin-containing monooxygenase [Chitinophagales bacterium]